MIDLSNKNILCTGANGFIGSNFVEYVFKNFEGVNIINIDKMGVGSRELNLESEESLNTYTQIVDDIANIEEYIKDLDFDIEYVFHFAAESHVDRSIFAPSKFVESNVLGTSILLQFLLKNHPKSKITCISTDEVYGHLELKDNPFTEDSPLAPRSPYAASKASSDLVSLSYHSTYGMDLMVTRCCNNYGKHQHDEKFIPTVIRSLVNLEKIPVYGNGENVREWIHVDDHNKAILELSEIGESGGVYNIGSGVEMSNIEMIRKIIEIFYEADHRPKNHLNCIKFVRDRKGHDFRYAIDSVRWTNSLEQKKFDEGLRETVKFYKEKYETRNTKNN